MPANIELIGYLKGERFVHYWTVMLYPGIVADYIERYERKGYKVISARVI